MCWPLADDIALSSKSRNNHNGLLSFAPRDGLFINSCILVPAWSGSKYPIAINQFSDGLSLGFRDNEERRTAHSSSNCQVASRLVDNPFLPNARLAHLFE